MNNDEQNEQTTVEVPADSAGSMSIEHIKQLYQALQSQNVPLVDAGGRNLQDLIPTKKILALSTSGDMVHTMCQYVLAWLVEYGDAELSARAINTRAYWEANQKWLIDWCNEHYYFHWCEMALNSPKTYKTAMEMFPSEAGSVDETVRTLALMFAEAWVKPKGLVRRRVVKGGGGKRTFTLVRRVNPKKRKRGSPQ